MGMRTQASRVFEPLLKSARYKGAYGGRGSGKSHFFGEHLVRRCVAEPGTRAVCIRELQRTLAQSSKGIADGRVANVQNYVKSQAHAAAGADLPTIAVMRQ